MSGKSENNLNGGILAKVSGPVKLTGVAALTLAGAMAAINARNSKRSRILKSLRNSFADLPSLDETIDWIEEGAESVGRGSERVQNLSGEARSISKMLK